MNGIATFNNLYIDKAASGYTLTATVAGLTSTASNSFNIAPGIAQTISFVTEPGGSAANIRFSTYPVLVLEDAYGNIVTSSNGVLITLTLKSGTGTPNAVLSGATSKYISGGVARFTDLTIDKVGTGYVLSASSQGYNIGYSKPFTITGLGQSTNKTLRGMDAINESDRWSVGLSGTIVATSDGGRTWWNQISNTTKHLYSVDFVDRFHGWIVGDGGIILKTTNGGHTWSQLTSGTTTRLHRVKFYDQDEGIVVGTAGIILKTFNGGQTWFNLVSNTNSDIHSISYASKDIIYAVGSNGQILKSNNGGQTWLSQNSPITINIRSINCQSTLKCWAVGESGRVLKTSNGGATWSVSVVHNSSTQDFNSVSFVNEENVS